MQEAGAGASPVTTPGECHRTAPSTTALHILAKYDPPLLGDLPLAMPTLLSADPGVSMLPRQVNYRLTVFKAVHYVERPRRKTQRVDLENFCPGKPFEPSFSPSSWRARTLDFFSLPG